MNTNKIYAEQIANEYAPKEESKVKALKKLDAKAKLPAIIFTYVFGIVSALLLGTGMCFCMGVLGNNSIVFMILGIAIGSIGIIGASINYYLYSKFLNKQKRKYASDILNLAKQISEEE